MVSRRFFKRRQNLDTLFLRYPDIYTIQSEVMRGVIYAVDKNKFSVFTSDGYAFCPIHEAPILARMMERKDIADEIWEIYEDLRG